DIYFLGQTTFGLYHNDCDGIHPDVIEEYYSTNSPPLTHQSHQSGAGHPIDEENNGDGADVGVIEAFVNQQWQHAHHEVVSVPSTGSPFINHESEEEFYTMLHCIIAQNITPNSFILTPDKWEDTQYPIYETIYVG
ncbi:hypothetical protein PAXRUDRAFT_165463, partial [Paxillus rubicundulus Ve08.2h10]